MVGADGEVGRRRPRLDLLVGAMGEAPVRETLDVSGEDWESILSGEMELDERLLARLEKMVRFNDLLHPVSSLQPRCRRSPMRLPSSQTNFSPYIPLSAGSGEKRAATTRYLSMARSAGGASGSVPSGCMTRIIARPWRSSTTVFSPFTTSKATLALKAGLCFLRPLDISHSPRQLPPPLVWEQDSRLATCQIFRVNLRFQGPQITQHFVQSIGEHVDIRGGVFESDRPRLETGT